MRINLIPALTAHGTTRACTKTRQTAPIRRQIRFRLERVDLRIRNTSRRETGIEPNHPIVRGAGGEKIILGKEAPSPAGRARLRPERDAQRLNNFGSIAKNRNFNTDFIHAQAAAGMSLYTPDHDQFTGRDPLRGNFSRQRERS